MAILTKGVAHILLIDDDNDLRLAITQPCSKSKGIT